LELDEIDKISISELIEKTLKERETWEKEHPPDPPNGCCYHAILSCIKIENSFAPKVHDYSLLFETEYEKIYVWTHTKNKESSLVSEVKSKVKQLPFWFNVGCAIYCANNYLTAFEFVDGFDSWIFYEWVYRFHPRTKFEDLDFYNNVSQTDFSRGTIKKATDILEISPIIDLLLNDTKCYTALIQIISSFISHFCCLICELGLSPVKMHKSHEPPIWEQAYLIPKMEAAILHACRCVEGILGKPPKSDRQSKVEGFKQKWTTLLNIDPDEKYEKANKSYFDYYYELFNLRIHSAHSIRDVQFDLERKKTILAQCFAALILKFYIENHVKSHEEIEKKYNFNTKLLNKVHQNMSTKMTYSKEFFKSNSI